MSATAQRTEEIQFPEKLAPLFQPKRYKVLYGGRGGAKSWGIARALLIKGAEQRLRILCAREIQKTIADSVHRLLSDQIAALSLREFYTITEAKIVGKNGTEFAFAGIRNQSIANLKSYEGFDICWVEEGQVVTKKSWDVLIPTIRKPGSEIWISFNPELDTDDTYKRFVTDERTDAIVIHLTYRDNPWFPQVLEDERRHLQKTDPDAYDNVWEGHCRPAVEGAIYAKEMAWLEKEKRIRSVPHDPLLKVHTVWDLGWNDQTSIILVQRLTSELRIIGYLEESYRSLDEWVAVLRGYQYNWGADWLPHDGDQARLEASGVTTKAILQKLGRSPQIVPNLSVEHGIKAARVVIKRCYFDRDRTSRLLECLKRYRRNIPAKTDEPQRPVHDEYSHGADAFRYLSCVPDKLTNEDHNFSRKIQYDNRGIV